MHIEHLYVVFVEMQIVCFNVDKISLRKFYIYLIVNIKENLNNDFVDRNNVNVPLSGNELTKFSVWGNAWRVFDDSFDTDQSMLIKKNLNFIKLLLI